MGIFDFFKSKTFQNTGLKPVILLVLDGWGLAQSSPGNPILMAKTPNMNYLWNNFPHTELIASGESVGLPANEVGNTEVGHLNMGAGRTIYQDLKKISMSIEDASFFDNQALLSAVKHVTKNNSKLHLIGLVSSGRVHSSLDHFFALLKFFGKYGINSLYLHLFTDGRDAPPKEGIDIIGKIEGYLKTAGIGKIATISGRYYGMDRDRRWDRTKLAYDAMTIGTGETANDPLEAVQKAYANGKTDEFIIPTVIQKNGKALAVIDDNDAAFFFNFRIDRPRQLTMAFTAEDFKKTANIHEFDPYLIKYEHKHSEDEKGVVKADPFQRQKIVKNLFFVTMTEYQKNLGVSAVAFPPEIISPNLAEVISRANFKQMHMAESEKERFVTYYFDGLREERLIGEDTLIVPSPKVATYDKKPEMSVFELVYKFKEALSKSIYKFFVVNFANPDMVAHSGNLKATILAVEAADKAVGELIEAVREVGGTVFITADHGNAEELLTFEGSSYFFTSGAGTINTDHSANPVPFIVVSDGFQKPLVLPRGSLADIAPTILAYMGLPIPKEMTGKNLMAGN